MSSTALGDNVAIEVESQYQAEQSDPDSNRFVFAYHITITNHNALPVQLMSRRWLIVDGDQKTQEVEGEGVVGEQPVIAPDESYSYTSGAVLATSVGSMQGHYNMVTDDGDEFIAPITPFTLARPNALH